MEEIMKTLVLDCMTKNPICLHPKSSIRAAFNLMCSVKLHHLPVVDFGRLLGIVSDRELLPHLRVGGTGFEVGQVTLLSDVEFYPIRTISPFSMVTAAAEIMIDDKIDALAVMGSQHELQGIITSRDILAWAMDATENYENSLNLMS